MCIREKRRKWINKLVVVTKISIWYLIKWACCRGHHLIDDTSSDFHCAIYFLHVLQSTCRFDCRSYFIARSIFRHNTKHLTFVAHQWDWFNQYFTVGLDACRNRLLLLDKLSMTTKCVVDSTCGPKTQVHITRYKYSYPTFLVNQKTLLTHPCRLETVGAHL